MNTLNRSVWHCNIPGAILGLLISYNAIAEQENINLTMSPEQLNQHIHEYLMNNPKVIIDAAQKYQLDQKKAADEKAQVALKEHREAIFDKTTAPVIGSAEGDVTVVEFLDYNCGYCRKVFSSLVALHKDDPKVRIMFRELPILGPESKFAARAALASHKQGLYWEFHQALITTKQKLTESSIMAAATRVGLDIEQLKQDMETPEIEERLLANRALAESMAITGTPTIIIGDTILRGAVGQAKLNALVDEERQAGS